MSEEHQLRSGRHRSIFKNEIAPEIDRVAPATEQPVAILLVGQPGAGTPPLRKAIESELGDVAVIDPDQLRERHPDYGQLLHSREDIGEALRENTEGWRDASIDRAIKNGCNLLLEETPRDPEATDAQVRYLQDAGYRVEIRSLAVNPDISIVGTHERFLNGKGEQLFDQWVDQRIHDEACDRLARTVEAFDRDGMPADLFSITDPDGNIVYQRDQNGVTHEDHLGRTGPQVLQAGWEVPPAPDFLDRVTETLSQVGESHEDFTVAIHYRTQQVQQQVHAFKEKYNLGSADPPPPGTLPTPPVPNRPPVPPADQPRPFSQADPTPPLPPKQPPHPPHEYLLPESPQTPPRDTAVVETPDRGVQDVPVADDRSSERLDADSVEQSATVSDLPDAKVEGLAQESWARRKARDRSEAQDREKLSRPSEGEGTDARQNPRGSQADSWARQRLKDSDKPKTPPPPPR